jgi:NADH dehydrogenase
LIAGGSGYVGHRIIERFGAEHDFINLSLTRPAKGAINNLQLDLTQSIDFLRLDRPVDMVINCVECHPRSGSKEALKHRYLAVVHNLLAFAKAAGVRRFMHFSVNNIDTVEDDYQQAKFVAEGVIEHAGVEHIIFKPSVIFGEDSPLDRFMESLLARRLLPRFWQEQTVISPVHITDVLSSVGHALDDQSCWNAVYPLCGPEYMGFEEMLTRRSSHRLSFMAAPVQAGRLLLPGLLRKEPNPHLKLLLNWIATDNIAQGRPLLRPKIFF